MPLDKKTMQLYTTLKDGGADVGSEQEFNDYFYAKGAQGYKNRVNVYNTLKDGGADVGKNYEEFAGWLGLRPRSQAGKPQPSQQPQQPQAAQTPWAAAMARRKQSQPTDYLHRPEMDEEDILSGQALRSGIDKRRQTVAQVPNKGMEQVRQAEAQRQQPIVKTNTPADQYVIKSDEQWENDVRQGASKSAQDLFGKSIDYEVGRVIDESTKRWEQAFDPHGMVGEGAAFTALTRANREVDPERLTRDLSNELQNRIGGWLQQPGKIEALIDEATKLDVSPDAYGEMVVNEITQQAHQKLNEKVKKGYMPKSDADYILNGMHDSLLGTVIDMMTMTKGQRQMMQQANAEYSQKNRDKNGWGGTVTDLVRGGVGFVGDAPVFGVLGKVASPMVRGTGAILERMGIRTTMGMSDATFQRLGQTVLNNSSALQRMKFGAGRAIAGSAYNFGLYEGTAGVMNDLSVGEDTSLGSLTGNFLEGFGKGTVKGAVLGAFARPMQGVSPRFGIRSDMNIGQKVLVGTGKGMLATGNIMAEGMGFTAGAYLVDEEARNRMKDSDKPLEVVLQDTMENTLMAGIFKIMNGHNMLHPVDALKKAFESTADSRFNFQRWQMKEIEDAYGGKGKFISALENFASSADAERNTKLSQFYEDFMNNNNISWDTKNKVSAILTGNMAMFPPIPSRISVDEDKKEVVAIGRRGEVLFRRAYETPEDADAIRGLLEMSRDEQMLHNLMGTFLVKDEEGNINPESQKQLDDAIMQVGYETTLGKEGVINALNTAPEKRTETAQAAVDILTERLYAIRFPVNQPHPVQDHQDGRDIADSTLNIDELDPAKNPNGVEPGKYDQLTQAYTEAQAKLEAAFKNNDTFYNFVNEQRANGLSDGEIALEARKMAFSEEETQALIDFQRTKERMDGYVELTGERIGEYISNEVSGMSFKGELDGQEVKDRFVRVVDDDGIEYYLRTGKVTVGEDGRLVSADGSNAVIVRDAKGKDKMVKADSVRLMPEDPANPKPDNIAEYSALRTIQLQEAISLAIDPEGKMRQTEDPKSQGQLAYEQEQGDIEQSGGLVRNDLADQILSESLRGSLHTLGRKIGKKIQVVTKEELKQINPSAPNNARGMRSADNKTLYLVSDIVKDNEYMQRFVTGHELTHSIKAESGDENTWNAFVDAVRSHMGDKAFDEAVKRVEDLYEKSGVHLDREAAIEEVCSDWAGEHMTDDASIRHIVESVERAGSDPVTFTQRIKQLFEDMIAAITGSGRTLSNDEKAQLEKLIKARDLWEQMYRECVSKAEVRDKAAEEKRQAEQQAAEERKAREEKGVVFGADGEADYLKMTPEATIADISEQAGAELVGSVIGTMLGNAKKTLKGVREVKPKSDKPSDVIAAAKETSALRKAAQDAVDYWQSVSDKHKELEAAAKEEERRLAEETARLQAEAERQERLKTPEGRAKEIAMVNVADRLKVAQEIYGDTFNGDMTPNGIEEYVMAHFAGKIPELGKGFIDTDSFEKETGHKVDGFGGDSKAYYPYLAGRGKGKTLTQVAEEIWQGMPEGLQSMTDDAAIKNMVIDLLTGAQKATDIRDALFNSRIAQAERTLAGEIERGEGEITNRQKQGKEPGGGISDDMPFATVEGDAPFSLEEGKRRKYSREIPKTREESIHAINGVVEKARTEKDKMHRSVIGGITERQRNDFVAKGINIGDNYVHSVENSAIIHNQNVHGDPVREEKRGQIAITDEDYKLIPEILDDYNTVDKSPNKDAQGRYVIIYTKEYPDGTIYYLEEVRVGRKSLAFKTMYKKKKGVGSSDGLMKDSSPLTSKTTSDNPNSPFGGKDSKNSYSLQEKEEESAKINTSEDPMEAINQAANKFREATFGRREEEGRKAFKEAQFKIIQKGNPAEDDMHTWIRSADEIRSYDEAVKREGYEEGEDPTPDYTADMMRQAQETGKMTVYSSKPIRDGIFVTPSKMEAQNYAGEGKVYSKEVDLTDVAWIDPLQGQYARVDENVKYSLIGGTGAFNMAYPEKGEGDTRAYDNMFVAEKMEKAGKDAKTIKFATGWERGKDGEWRYEIPDFNDFDPFGNIKYKKDHPVSDRQKELQRKSLMAIFGDAEPLTEKETKELEALKAETSTANLDDSFEGKTLNDFMDAPELFAAYPEFKDIKVKTEDLGGRYAGTYYTDGTIAIDESYLKKAKSPDFFESEDAKDDIALTVIHELQHAIQIEEGFARGDDPARKVNGKRIGNKAYRTSAGEVEARNVERRHRLSEEKRKSSLAEETEDVPRDKQIVYMGDDSPQTGATFSLVEDLNDPMKAIDRAAREWREERRVLGTKPNVHAETAFGGRMALEKGQEPSIEEEYAHYSLQPSPTNTPLQTDENRRYHDLIGGKAYKWIEAHQNDLQSVIAMQKAILGDGVEAKDYENVFYAMNHMGGVVMQKENNYARHYYSRINNAANEAAAKLRGDDKKRKYQDAMDEVTDYVRIKHGLERNRALYVRDNADEQTKSDFADLMDSLYSDLRRRRITFSDYLSRMDDFIRNRIDKNYNAGEHDMSGLSNKNANGYDDTTMTQDVINTEAELGEALTDELWDSINRATDYIMNERYESGLISKAEKERLQRQWHFYVPLKGWAEPTAEEMFDYNDHIMSSVGSPVLKRAGGRTSISDDPLAMIGADASRLIRDAELNRVHQTAVRLARGHKGNGLLEEMQTWYEKTGTDAQGNDIWEEAFPQWSENATADEITLAIEQFNADMQSKKQQGLARKTRRGLNIRHPMAVPSHVRQHIINAWVGGEKVRLYVQGNPRAAQALNGELRKGTDNKFVQTWDKVNRLMMGLNTSYNPEFIVSNGERDLEMAVNNLIVKEGREYTGRFIKNYFGIGGGNTEGNTGLLKGETLGFKSLGKKINAFNGIWNRYYNGTLDMSKESDRMFKEFMDNGGPTGYVTNQNLDKYKKELYKGVRQKDGNVVAKTFTKLIADPVKLTVDCIEELNTRVENLTRFAAYQTSRQGGRSVLQSIHDAKEVSVNFGTRGAGGNTGGVAGMTAAWGRHTFYFYNAGVQSLEMYARNIRKHPVKGVGTMMLKPFMVGAAVALWNMLNGSDDETGEKSYAQLNPWVRRNNLIIPAGDGAFWTYPLPIEIRAFYGMGEAAAGMFFEETRDPNPALTMAGQITQMTPVDVLSYMSDQPKDVSDLALRFGTTLLPSVIQSDIVQPALNMNFYGAPLQKEANPFDKNQPQWERTFTRDQNSFIYRTLKDWEQNTRTKPSEHSDPESPEMTKQQHGYIDISPAIAKHMISQITGGTGAWAIRMTDVLRNGWEWVFNGGENPIKESRSVPFVRTNYRSASHDNGEGRQRARLYDLKKMMKNMDENIKFYRKDMDVNPEHRLRWQELWDSEDGQIYREFYGNLKEIEKEERRVKKAAEGEAKRNAQQQLNEKRRVLLEQIDDKRASWK